MVGYFLNLSFFCIGSEVVPGSNTESEAEEDSGNKPLQCIKGTDSERHEDDGL